MYLGIILIIMIIIIDLLRKRNIFSPVVMLASLFLFILFLALMRLNGIRSFSNEAIYIIELGVIFFAFGSFLVEIIYLNFKKKKIFSSELSVNWFWMHTILILTTAGVMITLINMLELVSNGVSYGQIRNSLLGYGELDPLISNRLFSGIVNYISTPGLYALIPFAIYYLVNKSYKIFTIIVFGNMIFHVFSTGGRIILVYTIIQFLMVISYYKVKIPIKIKLFSFLLIVVSFFSIVIISNMRSSRSFLEVFYAYFSGPVVLLSEWKMYIDSSDIWSYGFSFLYPLSYTLNSISQFLNLDIEFLQNIVIWQGAPQNNWIQVFPDMSMNAFSTMFYFFYQDFRYLGVIFYSFVFGIVCSIVYFKAYMCNNSKYFLLYLLLVKAIVGSFMIWQLGSTNFFVSLVMMYLCLGRDKQTIQIDKI